MEIIGPVVILFLFEKIVNLKSKIENCYYRPGPMQTEPVNLVRRGTEQPYAVFGRAVANPADLY